MSGGATDWQLEPVGVRTRILLGVLCVALPVVLVLATSRQLVASATMLGVGIVVWFVLDRLTHRHRVAVDDAGLEVVTAMYRRRIAWPELRLDAARVIAIDEHPERKPRFKTNGMSTFGFNGGWFRSRDMGKLFVAMAGGKRLLWLPTTLGYTLLLEPRRPQALLDRLLELAPPARRR
ncbi:MAG: hypothetical protein M3Y70_03130 [Pseudomonadota bacterium]|nr:hypothetical protein [Pseudomonadota bacterium]